MVRWPLQAAQPFQKNHNSNHLSVHQWIRSAIRIHNNQPLLQVSYFRNFRHPLCGTTGMILSIWIQNSRFKAQEKLLQSNLFGFKIRIQDVFLGSWILNPTPWDSRSCFGILKLEPYPLKFKKSFWDLESWILPPWIQEVFLGSWILKLEPYPLGFKKSFWDLESRILDPM